MKITLLCVGKLKERYFTEAVAEYVKRLGRYAKVQIVEVEDEKTPEEASPREVQLILEKEGRRLLERLPEDACPIALAIDGTQRDSVGLARHLEELMGKGASHLCFVIGGSLGLSQEVLGRCREHMSFSKLTFPHQLMRVILLEQIYRSFRILRGEPYHK